MANPSFYYKRWLSKIEFIETPGLGSEGSSIKTDKKKKTKKIKKVQAPEPVAISEPVVPVPVVVPPPVIAKTKKKEGKKPQGSSDGRISFDFQNSKRKITAGSYKISAPLNERRATTFAASSDVWFDYNYKENDGYSPYYPNQKQDKHCWSSLVKYRRCRTENNVKRDDIETCRAYNQAFKSSCPILWRREWKKADANHAFPYVGPIPRLTGL
eukprot:TRINITY_DN640_c0_g1_i1.p1 TRINITY_DN640_c0_g1~~TRINITY_DN640_c0_g1_i1.p1  ORF type:complete len:213 (-),score=45.28 TRINITY_DN640_c0_g1_i1:87-725(-)